LKIELIYFASQLNIARNLSRLFSQTTAYKNKGELAWEVVMFLPTANRNRVGYLAYLTDKQLEEDDDKTPSVSSFVIEVISKNDTAYELGKKLNEYFDYGVQVVWQIFPQLKTVHVYTSPETVKICRGATVCSAFPSLPDFNITAQDIF
jgi:Uma2 family endonuclease